MEWRDEYGKQVSKSVRGAGGEYENIDRTKVEMEI